MWEWYEPAETLRISGMSASSRLAIHPDFPEDTPDGFVNAGALNMPAAVARLAGAEGTDTLGQRRGTLCVYRFRTIGRAWFYLPQRIAEVLRYLERARTAGRWVDVGEFEFSLGVDGRSQVATLRQMGITIITRRADGETCDSELFDPETTNGHAAEWLLVGAAIVGAGADMDAALEDTPPLSGFLPDPVDAANAQLARLEVAMQKRINALASALDKWQTTNWLPTPHHQPELPL